MAKIKAFAAAFVGGAVALAAYAQLTPGAKEKAQQWREQQRITIPLTVVPQMPRPALPDGVNVFHDDERGVTCWIVERSTRETYGQQGTWHDAVSLGVGVSVSCWPDWLLRAEDAAMVLGVRLAAERPAERKSGGGR